MRRRGIVSGGTDNPPRPQRHRAAYLDRAGVCGCQNVLEGGVSQSQQGKRTLTPRVTGKSPGFCLPCPGPDVVVCK